MIFILFFLALFLPAHVGAQTPVNAVLWGTDAGLYGRDDSGRVEIYWLGGAVKKIVPLGRDGGTSGWALLTSDGIWVSSGDLKKWEKRSHGLPEKVIKIYENGEKSFVSEIDEIKDLEIDPENPDTMVCAFKDSVYLSLDGGGNWKSLGMPNYRSNGIKAAAVTSGAAGGGGLTVFCSHSIYGVYYINPGQPGARWSEISGGLEKLETTDNPDEVSDIRVVSDSSEPDAALSIYAAQSFRPRLYKLDWERKNWNLLWSGGAAFGAADSISPGHNSLTFVRDGGVAELTSAGSGETASTHARANGYTHAPMSARPRQDIADTIKAIGGNNNAHCVILRPSARNSGPAGRAPAREVISLSELWLLDEHFADTGRTAAAGALPPGVTGAAVSAGANTARPAAPAAARALPPGVAGAARPAGANTARPAAPAAATRAANDATRAAGHTASGREGIYLPVNHAMDPGSLKPYLDIIENRGLNMVVIDMKDDYGRLRFTPENPSMKNLGRVFWPVDIDTFLDTMKARGIYTVARIVVFKDPEAARKDGAKYAVWDGRSNKAWEGYYDVRRKKTPEQDAPNPALVTAVLPADDPEYETLRTWYDEKWVDPYSEEIWEYNTQVAEELIRRGFDEIQFDYIRFPTDGANLADARYRWRETGMDMDSAILSFLRHVRSRIKAPVSVDIYGANGWYRTGARTGQEVELLSPWVDVICPMYYPSHFEQNFLAQNPPEERPRRIYHQGTLRTRIISRGRVTVRPWAQAFYLNVSYDRKYYNTEYVRLEAEGVRAAGSGGLTYWNNSGRYDDIPAP